MDGADRARAGKPTLLVSACLLGAACNHEGRAASRKLRAELEQRFRLVPVCPEVVGGLTTPRPAAELQAGATGGVGGGAVLDGDARVVNVEGSDVTAEYVRGADTAVEIARAVGAERAVLKARSPSCGSSQVYDGSFTGTLVDGEGVTAAALRRAGLVVTSEDDPLPE